MESVELLVNSSHSTDKSVNSYAFCCFIVFFCCPQSVNVIHYANWWHVHKESCLWCITNDWRSIRISRTSTLQLIYNYFDFLNLSVQTLFRSIPPEKCHLLSNTENLSVSTDLKKIGRCFFWRSFSLSRKPHNFISLYCRSLCTFVEALLHVHI